MKNEIRSKIRAVKKELGAERLSDMSVEAPLLIEANKHYREAGKVMLYYPLWDEVDCRPLFGRAFASGKRVILPTVSGPDIVPVEITPDTEWRVGEFNILEPVAGPYGGGIDLIVVPGMAFDSRGNRLGRGKGYYDRFLSLHPKAYRLGLCFGFQMIDRVPVEPFDLPMDEVVSVPVA